MSITVFGNLHTSDSSLFSKLACLHGVKFAVLSQIRSVDLTELTILDLSLCDVRIASDLEKLDSFFSGRNAIGLINRKIEHQHKLAKKLGISHVTSHLISLEYLDSLVKSLLAKRANSFDRTSYISRSDAFFDELVVSVLSDKPLPVKLGKEVASSIVTCLHADDIHSLLRNITDHHSPTYSHSIQVAVLASWFARKLGLSEAECLKLTLGGLLHDIGKSKISLAILNKDSELTSEERKIIKQHAKFGVEIVKDHGDLDLETKQMICLHHELLDGSGYPFGLAGDKISTNVRIITICDIFSALTEKRSYKSQLSHRDAIVIMNDMYSKLDQRLYKDFRRFILDIDGFGRIKRFS